MPQSENIGQVNVSVGADYSSLQAAIQGAESIAATGGKDIANALVAGASSASNLGQTITDQFAQVSAAAAATGTSLEAFDSQMAALVASGSTTSEALSQIAASMASAQAPINLFTDEIEPLAAEITAASGAAENFAAAENAVASSTAQASTEVQKSALTLQELAQALIAVGAAMVIVNKIEELGTAALQASDDITRAQISLTVLTGSAAAAADEIDKLDALGQSDGLSMPALLTAATRMQALLGATAQVPELLAQLANSAAVSGQGIESAANAFDRMATSGTAAARQLVPLGINLGDLANALNTLSGTSIATESNVASLFKQLSETERIEVLSQSLQKLNGIAAQARDETFGGQWAALAAQWSTVMADAGQALLPVIDDLIKLTETDIVPFLKGAIDLFRAIPGPIKDFTVLLGLTTIAALGTAAALGTLGIAIGGIKTLVTTLGFSTAAAEITEVGAAVAEVGTAAEVAEGGLAIAGVALSEFLVPIAAVVAGAGLLYAVFSDTAEAATKVSSSISFAGAQIDLAADGVRAIAKATTESTTAFGLAVQSYNQLNDQLAQGKATETEVAQAIAAMNAEFAKLPGSIEPVGLALANQALAAHNASNAYQTAKEVFQTVLAAYNAGAPVYAQLVQAQDALTASEKAAAAAGVPIPGTLEAIDTAAKQVTSSMVALASSHDIAAAKALAQSDSLRTLSQDVIVGSQKLALLATAQADAQRAADTHRGSEDQLRVIMDAVGKAAADLQQKQDALALATVRADNAAMEQQGAVGLAAQAVREASLAVQNAQRDFEAGTISAGAYTNAQKALVTAETALHQVQADTAVNVTRSTAAWAAADVELATARAKVADVTQAYRDHLATMQDVVSAQKAALAAQIAEDQENAVAATGTVGLTDKVSLYTQILAAAKAKLDDLTAASHTGQVQATDLAAAQDAVTSATNSLKQAQDACAPPVRYLNQQLDEQAGSAASANKALETIPPTLDSIASALKEVSDAFSTAKSASDAFTLSAQPGYKLSIANTPGGGFVVSEVPTPETAFKLALAGAISTADEQSNPNNRTDAASLDRQALAEAQATLQVYQDAFKAGSGLVTAQQVTTAAQAVVAAQQAIAALTGGVSSSASGTGLISSVVSGAAAPSGTLDSAAAGGTYPGVVIHQAAGELLYVALSNGGTPVSQASGGSTVDQSNATSALAASSTALAVSQAAGTISDVVGALVDLTGTIGTLAGTVTAAKQSTFAPGGTVTASLPKGFTGTWTDGKRYQDGVLVNGVLNGINYINGVPQYSQVGGTNVTGTPTGGNVGQQGNSFLPTADEFKQQTVQASGAAAQGALQTASGVLSQPVAARADNGAGTLTLNADFSGANFSGADAASIKAAIETVLPDVLTRQLRDSGARY